MNRSLLLALTSLCVSVGLCACSRQTAQEAAGEAAGLATRSEAGTGPVRFITELSAEQITTMDTLVYRMTLHIGPGYEADFPDIYSDEHLAGFIVTRREQREERDEDGTRRVIREYELEPEYAGELTLGGVEVFYYRENEISEEELTTELLTVTVSAESLSPDALALRPARGLITVEAYEAEHRRLWPWIAGIGIATLAAVGAGVWYVRRPRPVAPPPPAHEVALDALRALVARDLVAAGQVEQFFVLLSAIVRSYIEDAFGVHAPEQTTEEFLHNVSSAPAVAAHRTALAPFLQVADEVKFARYEPDKAVIQRAFDTARDFIQQTGGAQQADPVEQAA